MQNKHKFTNEFKTPKPIQGSYLTLAFETSCDETSAAVVDGSLQVLSNIVSSQIDIHKLYGGVVPEIASRNHLQRIETVMQEALDAAGVTIGSISSIAATTQPGLVGAVMVGRVFAESLAAAAGLPFCEINHLAGHIAAVKLTHKKITPPFLCLVVSGGHTSLYKITNQSAEKSNKETVESAKATPKEHWRAELLVATGDDACGEAFDKVGKLLGLPYPGGPHVAHQAAYCNVAPDSYIKFTAKADYSKSGFSYSGLKTAVLNYLNKLKQKGETPNIPLVSASFQHEAVRQLTEKCMAALQKHKMKNLCVCGGVSANLHLREQMTEKCRTVGCEVFFPETEFCGDNAAMIAAASLLAIKI